MRERERRDDNRIFRVVAASWPFPATLLPAPFLFFAQERAELTEDGHFTGAVGIAPGIGTVSYFYFLFYLQLSSQGDNSSLQTT